MTQTEALKWIDKVEERLKEDIRRGWSSAEKKRIKMRGETSVDFYRILFKLSKLESIRRWVYVYGRPTRSQINILKDYERGV